MRFVYDNCKHVDKKGVNYWKALLTVTNYK